ncbi:MAG: hypothetical protein H2069_06775 [Legionella sp.]|nr:hypothetical protein [Legionella sp.]
MSHRHEQDQPPNVGKKLPHNPSVKQQDYGFFHSKSPFHHSSPTQNRPGFAQLSEGWKQSLNNVLENLTFDSHFQKMSYQDRKEILELLISPNGITAYQEGLWQEKYILEGIKCGMNVKTFAVLMSDRGIGAWRQSKQYLNMNHVIFLNQPRSLELLLSENGITALQKQLITATRAIDLNPIRLSLLLSRNGIKALQNQWITIDQAMRVNLDTLEILLSDDGIQAFQDISLEIAQAMQTSKASKANSLFFNDNAIRPSDNNPSAAHDKNQQKETEPERDLSTGSNPDF